MGLEASVFQQVEHGDRPRKAVWPAAIKHRGRLPNRPLDARLLVRIYLGTRNVDPFGP